MVDVSYAQVTSNIEANIGTKVRWGGQITDIQRVDDDITHLTVYSVPP